MRKPGIIVILAAIPAWVFVVRFDHEARRSPFFGYEFGSVGMPIPPLLRVVFIFALLFTLVGLCLFALTSRDGLEEGPCDDAS
jgi:hypothetical protein